jgi:uncharacterized protein YcbK (DUF882 family)
MAVKTYSLKKDGNKKLSDHFKVKEFRCKDGTDKILIESGLIKYLEKVYDHFNCSRIDIRSAYRTPSHDKKVGGKGSGNHCQGKAVDFIAYNKNGQLISSKEIVLYLEDLGVKGIGYRCGGSEVSTHMDVNYRVKKWYGDEQKSMSASIGKSFYTYLDVKYSIKQTTNSVNVRTEPSIDGKKHKTLAKGTKVKMANTQTISKDGFEWVRVKIGSKHYWMAKKYLK